MRLGHATVRYNAKMSIGNTKQQSNKIFSRPPAASRSRQPPTKVTCAKKIEK